MNAGKGDTLRVAIIGYGHAGSIFHAPLVASTPGLDIAAVVTSQPDRQARVRRELPEAAVLSSVELVWERAGDFDLVVIVTPNRTYVTLALAALQAGLPVVVDKPLAASVADAKQLIVASQQAGKLLTVFQNARWSRGFLTVQRLIAAELLGPIVRYEAHSERYRPEPRPGAWRELGDAMEAGGLLYDLGSHLIDQALVLFGAPTSVYAEVDQRRPGTHVDDDTFVALHFRDGVRAHLWMSYVARRAAPALRVNGLRGTYEKRIGDSQEDMLRSGVRPGQPGWDIEPRELWGNLCTDILGLEFDGPFASAPGGYDRFYALVRDALNDGSLPPVNPRDALTALLVIEAAQRSSRTKTVVRF
jgi:scyllo-inositol 2-dehydrogenase (NADP+)